ncbi:MAG: hypothetical protein DCF21_17800 [Leptolyngbya sp.]|jgi:ribosomal 50S subunit-recycling heat shock protein|uniref:Uncharacterized protein n=1 Tax=Shackletoniella antarctica TaxID=268115 RepID=A0A2W4WFK9_9CYAN|nr:MAG: hypothetical protein DCF17_11590 [Shackletoniella antarctica]PZV10830.1 MAG: hypothetical protein DCF21_17800 [Leptolyngbya sp.]
MSDYTTEELQIIVKAPLLTGLSVALVDLGIVSTAIEAAALSKEIAGAAQKYPGNSIIQAALSEEALKSGKVKLEKPEIKPEDVESGTVIDSAIAACNTAIQVVEGKSTAEEIAQYKQFIYDSAVAVAEAAGRGIFGSGSQKVSDREAAALDRLKIALAV